MGADRLEQGRHAEVEGLTDGSSMVGKPGRVEGLDASRAPSHDSEGPGRKEQHQATDENYQPGPDRAGRGKVGIEDQDQRNHHENKRHQVGHQTEDSEQPVGKCRAEAPSVPAEVEDEAEIDAKGDQTQTDQVECLLIELLLAGGRLLARLRTTGPATTLPADGLRRALLLGHPQGFRRFRRVSFTGDVPSDTRIPDMIHDGDSLGGRILVVEDDEEIVDVLRRTLRAEGYEVRAAIDGATALEVAVEYQPDLLVLDLGLPDMDGLEVCGRMREVSEMPILMLTARIETADRVGGLDAGADDYLTKPFERAELLARVRALLRRTPPRGSALLTLSDLKLNPDTREVFRGEREIELTKREFELLEYLMRNQRLVISRQRLLEEVWGYDPLDDTNTIDVFISNLRKKLEEGGEGRLLHTKRGAGYLLKA